MKHTPGPWSTNGHAEKNEHGTWVAPVFSDTDAEKRPADTYGTTKGQARTNARLIAASPELLEALEIAREWMGSDPGAARNDDNPGWADRLDAAQDQVDAAIAKAEGHP